jgi:AcrR family transcriptional regulator
MTERFDDKREAILDGAARLFNQHGIKGGLLSDLARRVGLATNSLTYYYRKKEDLASACLQRSIDALSGIAIAAAQQRTLAQRVRGLFAGYLKLLADIAEGRHPELIVFNDLLSLPAPHGPAVGAAYTQMFRRVRTLLDAADQPRLESAQRNARAHLLLSTVAWTRAWIRRYEPVDYARAAAQMADLLLSGIAAPGHAVSASAAPIDLAPDGEGAHETRDAYLRAATRLVNEHGYPGASVDRIAAELQLTKGSFYHHHETKEELVAACFERTFAVMRAAQSAALAAPGSALERLALACRALLHYQMSPQGPLFARDGVEWPARRDPQRHAAHDEPARRALWRAGGRGHGRWLAAHRRSVDRSTSDQCDGQCRSRGGALGAGRQCRQCVRAVCAAAVRRAASARGDRRARDSRRRLRRGYAAAMTATPEPVVVAAAEPLPDFQTLPDLIAAHRRARPDATALVCGDERLSYAESMRRWTAWPPRCSATA